MRMPARDPARRRAVWNAWYHRTKSTPHQRQIRREARRRKTAVKRLWFESFRQTLCCEACGERHPGCLQFHHRNPGQKAFAVANAIGDARWSLSRIKEEIKKCRVLCANCHVKLHVRPPTRTFLPRIRTSKVLGLWKKVMNALDAYPTARSLAELVPEESAEEEELAEEAPRRDPVAPPRASRKGRL